MGGWNTAGNFGWQVRRERAAGVPQACGRWTPTDVGVTIVAFLVHWELGLAFLALKLWQQASGYNGSVFAFARDRWESLVGATRGLMANVSAPSMGLGPRSSGNHAFDTWRQTELDRIEAERAKLRAAEREFAAYRDELLHVKDREDFERFMTARGSSTAS